MGIFSVTGIIRSLGQSEFDNHGTRYAFVDIVEPSGKRVLVQNVFVGNQVLPIIDLGTEGEFFFDKMFVPGKPLTSQLWGVKTHDGLVAYDHNLRIGIAIVCLVFGTLFALIGVGIPFLIVGIVQLIKVMGALGARQRLFYGHDREKALRLRQQQAVQL